MKRSLILAAILAASATPALPGGPVVVEEEAEVAVQKPRSGALVPIIIGLLILGALAGGDDPAPPGGGDPCKGRCR